MVDPELIIAVVSLIISIIAFIVSIAQALQQYISSAEGYRKCRAYVMGAWASKTERRFRLTEVRFEVLFETPVLFVAPPTNKKGPIDGREIYNVTGDQQSLRETMTLDREGEEGEVRSREGNVHTADDERASWVTLLSSLQTAAREARAWDEGRRMTARGKKYEVQEHTVVVQVQRRKRSWDFMPDSVVKPYATTTITHLVEMSVMLGMLWRAFDQDNFSLRAEGNGYILTSSMVQGLGVVVTFAITGKSKFTETSMIPCIEIKQLVFGSVPIFLGERVDDKPKTLDFGDDNDTRRTLQWLNCSQDTIEKFFVRRKHVYSISFEIIGMLAQTYRLRGTSFHRLPNPTKDLPSPSIPPLTFLTSFITHLSALSIDPKSRASTVIPSILAVYNSTIAPLLPSSPFSSSASSSSSSSSSSPPFPLDIDTLEALHTALSTTDTYLLSLAPRLVLHVVGSHLTAVLHDLADLDSFLSSRDCDTAAELLAHYFHAVRGRVVGNGARGLGMGMGTPTSAHPERDAQQQRVREDVWVSLMWRMSCWWCLHDFEGTDTMILPPRLKGSRLPVYVL